MSRLDDDEALRTSVRDGLDARGAVVDERLWARICAVAPRSDGRVVLRGAHFDGATFEIDDLSDTVFERCWFNDATFERGTSFHGSTFAGGVSFSAARFRGRWAGFTMTVFESPADFLDAVFEGQAAFGRARLQLATFNGARFLQDARFDDLEAGDASFVGARFEADLGMRNAVFESLDLAEIHHSRPLRLGPLTATRLLVLDRAVFDEPFTLVAAADFVSARDTRFRERASLELRWAEVALDGAQFARPSVVAWTDETEAELAVAERGRSHRPRVVSLRDADVDGLFLAGVDLQACRMHGARNLDRLRIGSGCRFARSPRGWRWADREVLAEEHLWRAKRGGSGWNPPECHAPGWVQQADRVPPHGVIAAVYRDLRKAREDHKDEPGAASFYYGEMEMRRHDPKSEAAERAILFLYWLVAGYGLRASRALGALAVTVLVSALVLAAWGFSPGQGFGRALLFSAESTSSLFRVPPTTRFELTVAGEVTQLAVRLLGPLFFALALISLRGRVKRG